MRPSRRVSDSDSSGAFEDQRRRCLTPTERRGRHGLQASMVGGGVGGEGTADGGAKRGTQRQQRREGEGGNAVSLGPWKKSEESTAFTYPSLEKSLSVGMRPTAGPPSVSAPYVKGRDPFHFTPVFHAPPLPARSPPKTTFSDCGSPKTPIHLGRERRLSFLPPSAVIEGLSSTTSRQGRKCCDDQGMTNLRTGVVSDGHESSDDDSHSHGRRRRSIYGRRSRGLPADFQYQKITLDQRSWLEVYDKKHRYGKNLRIYYAEWARLKRPRGNFFTWLDESGIELPACSRSTLESDTVQYLDTDEEREIYQVNIQGCRVEMTCGGDLVDTGVEGWIFVIRNGLMYAAKKRTKPPRLHHSSFFGGQYVEAAGVVVASQGILKAIYPHSGHYRPNEGHCLCMLAFLHNHGTDLGAILMDAQRIFRTHRPEGMAAGAKTRKVENLHLLNAMFVYDFLVSKRAAWSSGLFDELHLARAMSFKDLRLQGRANSFIY